jgi:hypothetical protein
MASIHDQWAGRSIRVSLPHKIAFDIDAFLKAQQSVLDRIGMAACCSDIDIRWDVQEAAIAADFRIGDNGAVVEDRLDRGVVTDH